MKKESENEFEKRILDIFHDRYQYELTDKQLEKEESKPDNWYGFKEYLRDVAIEIDNPAEEGIFIRLLYRDYLVNNYNINLLE